MPKNNNEPPHLEFLKACLQCGYCRSVCPVFDIQKWESSSPRGKVYWLNRLIYPSFLERVFGRTPAATDRFFKSFFECTGCGRCEANCHVNIDFVDYWEEVKAWFIENGYTPPQAGLDMHTNLMSEDMGNPFKEPREKRDEWYKDSVKLKDSADVFYFPGCNTSYYEYKVLNGIVKAFNKAGIDYTMGGTKEQCCGSVALMFGITDGFEKLAKRNVDMVKKTGATKLVANCPSCLKTFKRYSEHVDVPFEVLHVTEYLADLIDSKKLTFKKEFKGKDLPMVYHDPCELGRHLGIYEAPRKILENIPGLGGFMEFDDNKKDSVCCGGGGGLKATDFDLSSKIAGKKIDMVIEMGANTVVTCCPNCESQISVKAQSLENAKIRTMDVCEIVAKCV